MVTNVCSLPEFRSLEKKNQLFSVVWLYKYKKHIFALGNLPFLFLVIKSSLPFSWIIAQFKRSLQMALRALESSQKVCSVCDSVISRSWPTVWKKELANILSSSPDSVFLLLLDFAGKWLFVLHTVFWLWLHFSISVYKPMSWHVQSVLTLNNYKKWSQL